MFRLWICCGLLVLAGAEASRGQTKVGDAASLVVSVSPSVRANGMGQVGTALITAGSYLLNPATVGLQGDRGHLSFAFYPTELDWNRGLLLGYSQTFLLTSASYRLRNSPFRLGAAFYRTRLQSPVMREIAYFPDPGRTFRYKEIVSDGMIGAAYEGYVDLGAGIAVKRLTLKQLDWEQSSDLVDFGFVLAVPVADYLPEDLVPSHYSIVLTPSLGVSWNNYGSPRYRKSRARRLGVGLHLGLTYSRIFADWEVISVTGGIDGEKLVELDSAAYMRYGTEVGLLELGYLRLGRTDPDDMGTVGFTVSSRGLLKGMVALLTADDPDRAGVVRHVASHLSVDYSYAHYDEDSESLSADLTFHEVMVTWWP